MSRLSRCFLDERIVAVVITLNTVFIGIVLSEQAGTSPQTGDWSLAHWGDYLCALFFVVEALVKIRTWGWAGYWSAREGYWWNRFDFSIALASLPLLLAPLLGAYSHKLLVLLVLRTTRLLRLFRFLRFIPNLPRVISGVPRALLTSSGIMLVLLLALIIFGFSASALFPESQRFGTPGQAVFSMFQVLTLEGWADLEAALEEGRTPLGVFGVRLFFVLAVGGFGLIGVALATAVLVDEMRADDSSDVYERFDAIDKRLDLLQTDLEALRQHLGAGRRDDPS